MWITTLNVTPDVDDYAVHKSVFRLFSKSIETMGRTFCYRRAGDRVVIYSLGRVSEHSREFNPVKSHTYEFSMIACPGRGTYRDENGKRHRMTPRTRLDDVFGWIERRVGDSASIDTLNGKRLANRRVIRPCGKTMQWPTWLLAGTVTAKQPKSFDAHVHAGMGQGGAFGMGLMFMPEALCDH